MMIRAAVLVTLCLLAASAHGQRRAAAFNQHVQQGAELHRAGRYQDAIRAFSAAYAIKADPLLLRNIGIAHRRLGQWDQALQALERFLQGRPAPADRVEVEALMAGVRAAQQAERDLQQISEKQRQLAADRARLLEEQQRLQERQRALDETERGLEERRRSLELLRSGAQGERAELSVPPPPRATRPPHQSWWLWTAVGAVVAGGVVAGAVAGTCCREALSGNDRDLIFPALRF